MSIQANASMPPVGRRERLWGLGGTLSAEGLVARPGDRDAVEAIFGFARMHRQTITLRGAGRSYGDVALNSGGICVDLTGMNRILDWDPAQGTARVEPGVTIRQLWQQTIADGWWPAVVPGTMFVTIGGCAAANVHGKNHWNRGVFGDHILSFELLLPSGEVRRCSRAEHAELFHAALGGCGLFGCFVSLTLQLQRVHSGLLDVRTYPVRCIDEMLGAFEARRDVVDQLVGWVDCLASGGSAGRGRVHEAGYLHPGDDPHPGNSLRIPAQELPTRLFGVLPAGRVRHLLRPAMNDPGARLVNAATYHISRLRGAHSFRQPHAHFAFLLDRIPDWWRAYGRSGFMEYQCFIPQRQAAEVFRTQLALFHRRGVYPYASALKLHRPDPFLITYGVDGFSLGYHLKVTPANRAALAALSMEFDQLVLGAGGFLYFAKDSTTRPATVQRYLGTERLDRFFRLKQVYDPDDRMQSDLYRRLFLPIHP